MTKEKQVELSGSVSQLTYPVVTRSEAEFWLRDVVGAKLAFEDQWDAFCAIIGGATESPFGEAAWRPLSLLVDCVADLLGDDIGTVSWFVWDNEVGKKGLKHSLPCGTMRPVKTIDDLLDVLGY